MSSVNDNVDYPRTWSFDEDGDRLEGTFVELGEAPTTNGYKPIATLEIGGEHRTVWLFHEALASRFREELERRKAADFTLGERIVVERGDWKESASGRRYRAYRVRFPDAPRRTAQAILGTAGDEPDEDEPEQDEGIPF